MTAEDKHKEPIAPHGAAGALREPTEAMREAEAYLKKIRRTIKASEDLIAKAELRIAETDRLLEKQGLSREQLASITFTEEQLKAVNDELARHGFAPIAREELEVPVEASVPDPIPSSDPIDADGSAENRRRKFGAMMQQFRM